MTRGNQREIDRMRAANRHAHKGEAKTGDYLLRKENDAKALAEKVAAKKARDEAIARGELPPETAEPKRGHGGGAVKASAKKK